MGSEGGGGSAMAARRGITPPRLVLVADRGRQRETPGHLEILTTVHVDEGEQAGVRPPKGLALEENGIEAIDQGRGGGHRFSLEDAERGTATVDSPDRIHDGRPRRGDLAVVEHGEEGVVQRGLQERGVARGHEHEFALGQGEPLVQSLNRASAHASVADNPRAGDRGLKRSGIVPRPDGHQHAIAALGQRIEDPANHRAPFEEGQGFRLSEAVRFPTCEDEADAGQGAGPARGVRRIREPPA